MRRLPLILGLLLITGLIVHGLYEFVVTNEGIPYFSSEPIRLLYAALLGVVGGLFALGFSRFPPAVQRHLKLLALGGFGLFLIGGTVFAGHLLSTLRGNPIVYDGVAFGWILAAIIAAALATGLVAWEFLRVWRQRR